MRPGCNLPGCNGHQAWKTIKPAIPMPPPTAESLHVELIDTYWSVTRGDPRWVQRYEALADALDSWWHFYRRGNWK